MSSQDLRWRDLLPGLLALTACVLAAVFVLLYARVGALRGDTFPLVVLGGSSQDLLQGTEVWLAGQAVGQIEGVEFRPPSTDTTSRLAIRVRVYERARPLLRSDSYAHITTGGSPLGASVLALTPGSPAGQPLADGDTIQMRQRPALGAIASELTAGARLEELVTNVEALGALVGGTRGTVGAVLHDDAATREMARLSQRGGAVASRLGSPGGTVGGFTREGLPQRRLERAMARVDSIRRLLASEEGNLGRFRRDSTLLVAIDDVRNELDILRALMASPTGTVGRIATDGIVAAQLDSVSAALGALAQDVRRRPFRYLIF